METSAKKRTLFVNKCEIKSPVKFKGLSPSKSGITFFNSNTGSRFEDLQTLPFAYVDTVSTNIENIDPNGTSSITVIGEVKWNAEQREVFVGEKKLKRIVRDATLGDNTGTFPLSVWGDLVSTLSEEKTYNITNLVVGHFNGPKLGTTAGTIITPVSDTVNVNWGNVANATAAFQEVKLAEIVSVRFNSYIRCINQSCKKKLFPFLERSL